MIITLWFIHFSCFGQANEKLPIGTKGINHESIALAFMQSLENEDYNNWYELISTKLKSDLSLEDFKCRMEKSMLKIASI